MRVLHRLVTAGKTVVAIEHNLDVIAEADWIVGLGPGGGERGGLWLRGAGDVEWAEWTSHTAEVLTGFLRERRN